MATSAGRWKRNDRRIRPGRNHRSRPDRKTAQANRLTVNNPNPHADTRLVRKLESGNYLAYHESDGCVRESSHESGEVVWQLDQFEQWGNSVPNTQILALKAGNPLMNSDGHPKKISPMTRSLQTPTGLF